MSRTRIQPNISLSSSSLSPFCVSVHAYPSVRTFAAGVSRKLLVATDLVAAVSAKMGLEEGDLLKVVETFKGKDLVGIK